MAKTSTSNAINAALIDSTCPMFHAMHRLSGRWKLLLLWYIHLGLNRFGLLRKRVPGLTTKMLAQQLKELEADGLITKEIFAEIPPRTQYAVAPEARELMPILMQLNGWGRHYLVPKQAESLAEPAQQKSPTG